jgi:hypothetical protein
LLWEERELSISGRPFEPLQIDSQAGISTRFARHAAESLSSTKVLEIGLWDNALEAFKDEVENPLGVDE